MKYLLLLLIALTVVAGGCSAPAEEPGYSKDDFAKRPVPAGYGPPKSTAPQPPATGK